MSRPWNQSARRRILLASAAFASSLLACQIIIGIEDEPGVPAAPDAGPGCDLHHPVAPGNLIATPGQLGTKFYAIRTYHVRVRDTPPLGYDLDERCTGFPDASINTPSCVSPTADQDAGDDDGGVDNAFGRLAERIPSFGVPDFAGEGFSSSADRAIQTILVQLSDYNGQPNDNNVSVGLVSVKRISRAGCDTNDVVFDPGEARWDGCDVWNRVDEPPDSWIEGATIRTLEGYVVDNKLVARRPGMKITFGLTGASLTVDGALITATIVPRDTGGIELRDGIIAGRVETGNFIQFAGRLELDPDSPICKFRTEAFLSFKETVCRLRDIRFDPATDSKNLPCDAISFALGFDAVPVPPPDPPKAQDPPPDLPEVCFDGTCP